MRQTLWLTLACTTQVMVRSSDKSLEDPVCFDAKVQVADTVRGVIKLGYVPMAHIRTGRAPCRHVPYPKPTRPSQQMLNSWCYSRRMTHQTYAHLVENGLRFN